MPHKSHCGKKFAAEVPKPVSWVIIWSLKFAQAVSYEDTPPRGGLYGHPHSEDDGVVTYEGLVTHPRGTKQTGIPAQRRSLAFEFSAFRPPTLILLLFHRDDFCTRLSALSGVVPRGYGSIGQTVPGRDVSPESSVLPQLAAAEVQAGLLCSQEPGSSQPVPAHSNG